MEKIWLLIIPDIDAAQTVVILHSLSKMINLFMFSIEEIL